MATEPVSLRMNTDLLSRIDEEAQRAGLSRTQAMERGLHYWLGRSAVSGGMLPAGFTEQFQSELASLVETGTPGITVLVVEPTGRAWTFSGAVPQHEAREALASGFLTLHVRERDQMTVLLELPIPRGWIAAWTSKSGPAVRQRIGFLWRAIDGNAYLAQGGAPFR